MNTYITLVIAVFVLACVISAMFSTDRYEGLYHPRRKKRVK